MWKVIITVATNEAAIEVRAYIHDCGIEIVEDNGCVIILLVKNDWWLASLFEFWRDTNNIVEINMSKR